MRGGSSPRRGSEEHAQLTVCTEDSRDREGEREREREREKEKEIEIDYEQKEREQNQRTKACQECPYQVYFADIVSTRQL